MKHLKVKAEEVSVHEVQGFEPANIVAIIPNSGNHGYCLPILSEDSVKHFQQHLMSEHISTFDRTFLWRILYNNVFLGKLKGNDYVQLVIDYINQETHSHILPWVLMMTSRLLSYNL